MNYLSRIKHLVLPVGVGVWLAWALLAGLGRASADLPAGGADLGPGSEPYEINVDASGRLWISEYGAGQARHVDPATGVYTLYTGLPAALDAQLDGSGQLWWAGYEDKSLGWLDPATGAGVTYTVDIVNPWNFAFDDSGKLWIMDDGVPGITTFEPQTESECFFELPNAGGGAHNRYRNGALWVSDWMSDAILRITTTTNVATRWSITDTADTSPYDLDFEADGTVWFADTSLGRVMRLEPDTNEITAFGPAELSSPATVLVQGSKTWYTDYFYGTLGFIEPAVSTSTGAWTVTPEVTTLTSSCYTNTTAFTFTAGISTGTLLFDSLVLTSTVTAQGTTYHLPADNGAWGLARLGGDLWVTGYANDRLYRVEIFKKLFLPLVTK
jgi:streptogramin lyase